MYGAAIYFGEHSSKCNQYVDCPICGKGCISADVGSKCICTKKNDTKPYVMLYCRVTLGNPCK